jgi:DNA (cytosine-5)-methyltransferase 1
LIAFGGNNQSGPIDVATAQTAHGGAGRMDFESETFVAHALRAEGFDASEDGTGRGTPLVPIAYRTTGNNGAYETGEHVGALGTGTDQAATVLAIQERAASENPHAGPDGAGVRDDGASYTLEARTQPQTVAFAENSRSELRLCGGDGTR